jgi:hypothetical protein
MQSIFLNRNTMEKHYALWIDVSEEKVEVVDNILGVKSNTPPSWELKLIEKEDDEYIPFIDYFLSILEGKYDQLEEIGVTRGDITVWFVYYYDSQCNMEFSPKDMYNLGKEGIGLCISCYDIHDYEADEDELNII